MHVSFNTKLYWLVYKINKINKILSAQLLIYVHSICKASLWRYTSIYAFLTLYHARIQRGAGDPAPLLKKVQKYRVSK